MHRLKTKLIIYFLSIITIPLVGVGYFTYFYLEKVIQENTGQYVYEVLSQANERIENMLQDLLNVAVGLNVNDELISLVKSDNASLTPYQQIQNNYSITHILMNTINAKREIYSVTLFTDKQTYSSTSSNDSIRENLMRQTYWFRSISTGKKDMTFIAKNTLYIQEQPKTVNSLVWPLKDLKNARRLGVVVVNMDEKVIERVLHNINFDKQSSIFLLDENNNIVYNGGSNLLGLFEQNTLAAIQTGPAIRKVQGKKYFIISHLSAFSHWRIIWFIPYKTLVAKAIEIRNAIFLVSILCVIMAFIISLTLSSRITFPMKLLIKDMNRVRKGDLTVRAHYRNFYEIQVISNSFNKMINDIQELIEKVYNEQKEKKKAEMKMLETQMNPHFLYNTLDSIKWVAILQKSDHIASMITGLARLLQISLSSGNELITVSEEIEHVKRYLEIQQLRYVNRLEVIYDLPEDVLRYKTLKILLQPLVENALFHGIGPKKNGGTIKISVRTDVTSLVMTVQDDGVGVETRSLEELIKLPKKNSSVTMYKGIGLRNIDERIRLYFGNPYGIKVISKVDRGTEMIITLPLLTMEGENDKGINS